MSTIIYIYLYFYSFYLVSFILIFNTNFKLFQFFFFAKLVKAISKKSFFILTQIINHEFFLNFYLFPLLSFNLKKMNANTFLTNISNSLNSLEKIFPWLANIARKNEMLESFIQGTLPTLSITLFNNILPIIITCKLLFLKKKYFILFYFLFF